MHIGLVNTCLKYVVYSQLLTLRGWMDLWAATEDWAQNFVPVL